VRYQIDGHLIHLSEPFGDEARAWIAAAMTITIVAAAFAGVVEWLKRQENEGASKLVKIRTQLSLAAIGTIVAIFLLGIDPYRRTTTIDAAQQTVNVHRSILSNVARFIFSNRVAPAYEADEVSKFALTKRVHTTGKGGSRRHHEYNVPAVFLTNGDIIPLTGRSYTSVVHPSADTEALAVVRDAWQTGRTKPTSEAIRSR
jgi:hypothetical protein